MDHSTNEDLYVTPDRFGISFGLASDGVTLSANFAPNPGATPLELAMLKKLIDQLGYGHLPIQQDKLSEVVYKQRTNNEGFTIAISGHRDGSLEIETSKDRMNAMAYVHHPSGEGQPLSAEIIQQQLAQAKVSYGIIDEIVDALIEDQGKTMVDEIIIAQGKAPIDGQDARFVSLVQDVAERRPPLLDDEPVDYREFGGVDTVAPGDRILRRVPPTDGEDGFNVFGETIPAKAGRDKELKLNRSVQLDPEDPDIVIANIGGQPVITERGGFVEKLVTLDDVDLKSGNIEFDGTVIVKGDVKSGMKVKASGDINVMGTVDAATMEAEGSVTVNGGIIGHGAVRDDKGNLRTGSGYVKAKGSVMARFYKNVII
ncbi:MAG: FapA family protein, partial [Gammaproteobacteria bacterium]|nr:FapA family protein [Gammaproteobacteria bacterium]